MNNALFFASAGDERATPQEVFDTLNAEFGFTLDAAAGSLNHKCDLWFGEGGLAFDALLEDWGGEGSVVWLNPPYSTAGAFVAKAAEEAAKGATVVLLLPARTDTKWWHRYIQPYAGLNRPWGASTHKLAWAAGVIDGEGCIGAYANHPDKGDHLMYLRLTVTNTDQVMLENLQRTLKVGNIRQTREAQGNARACWCWECNSADAVTVLEAVYPYLVTKQHEALLALQFSHEKDPAAKRELMDALADEKRQLPSRGGVEVEVRFIPGRLRFELKVSDELRALINGELHRGLAKGPLFDDDARDELVKQLVEQTGLPKMAIEGIWEGKPDEDLLTSAPFPSAVIVMRGKAQ